MSNLGVRRAIVSDPKGDAPLRARRRSKEGPGPRAAHIGGAAAITGAFLAIVANAVIFRTDAKVPSDLVSYPLSANDFRLGQIFFAITQALMAAGIVALVRSGIAGRSRRARAGALLAAVGFLLTVPGELVLALVADATIDSGGANAASSVFGLGVLIADIGLVLFGVEALRAGIWPRHWAALPVVVGVFQLFVVTPVVLGAGFASGAALAVITVQDLLIALLGVRLIMVGRQDHDRVARSLARLEGATPDSAVRYRQHRVPGTAPPVTPRGLQKLSSSDRFLLKPRTSSESLLRGSSAEAPESLLRRSDSAVRPRRKCRSFPFAAPARDASEPIDIRAVGGCPRCPLTTGAAARQGDP